MLRHRIETSIDSIGGIQERKRTKKVKIYTVEYFERQAKKSEHRRQLYTFVRSTSVFSSSGTYAWFISTSVNTDCIRSSSSSGSTSLTSSITERADIFVLSVVPPREPTKKFAARGVVNDPDGDS